MRKRTRKLSLSDLIEKAEPGELKLTAEQERELGPVEAPSYYAGSFRAVATGTEFLLAVMAPELTSSPNVARNKAVCVLTMSPQSFKDLKIMLSHLVANYESEWGAIETPYVRRLAADNDKKKKRH